MKKLFIINLFVLVTFFSTSAIAQTVGTISEITGNATKQGTTDLQTGMTIALNDTIMTGADSSLTIRFLDNTVLAMGAGTQLTIDEYVYDPQNNKVNKAHLQIKKGPFHYVSGLIGKKEKPDVKIDLDFGSIGIRGTKIWRDMTMTDDGKPQCRIYVEDGSVRVNNGKGFTILGDGDGTRIAGLSNPPTPSKPWGEAAIADIKSKSPSISTPE